MYLKKSSSKELANALYNSLEDKQNIKLLICFADILKTDGENMLKELEKYEYNFTVAGGLSGDNAKFQETMVFNENNIQNNGLVAAAFYGEDLIVNVTKSFGWKRIGRELKITKAKDNIVSYYR